MRVLEALGISLVPRVHLVQDLGMPEGHSAKPAGTDSWPMFEVPHLRPRSLKDPYSDECTARLMSMLAKADEELDWADYQRLLAICDPAGSYEEVVYFLPHAFSRILNRAGEALDLVSHVIAFVSEHARELQADGSLESARMAIRGCLANWTRSFEVTHRDCDVYIQKSIVAKYYDHVHRHEVVGATLEALVRFKTHMDLAEEFLQSLAEHGGDSTKAAWYLELARSFGAKEVRCLPRHAPFIHLVRDPQLLREAAATVRAKIIEATEPSTYWRDLFRVVRPLRQ